MSNTITGIMHRIYDTVQVSEKFKKREFVVELSEEINGVAYVNYAKMQAVQTKCDMLNSYSIGDKVEVHYNVKGTRYEKEGKEGFFSNLDAWKIVGLAQTYQPAQQPAQAPPPNYGQNNGYPAPNQPYPQQQAGYGQNQAPTGQGNGNYPAPPPQNYPQPQNQGFGGQQNRQAPPPQQQQNRPPAAAPQQQYPQQQGQMYPQQQQQAYPAGHGYPPYPQQGNFSNQPVDDLPF